VSQQCHDGLSDAGNTRVSKGRRHTTVFSRSVLPARATFPEQVSPPAMLAFADDAALARLVMAAAQRRARLTPRSFPIARSEARPCGLERSPDA